MKEFVLCRCSVWAAFFAGVGVSSNRFLFAVFALILAVFFDAKAYKRKKFQSSEAPSLD